MEFHERLAKACDDRRVTQREVARALDVSVSTVNRWLQGDGEPRISEAVALAKFLGVDVLYLAGVEGRPSADELSADERVLVNHFRYLGDSVGVNQVVHAMSKCAADNEFYAAIDAFRQSGTIPEKYSSEKERAAFRLMATDFIRYVEGLLRYRNRGLEPPTAGTALAVRDMTERVLMRDAERKQEEREGLKKERQEKTKRQGEPKKS